MFNTIKTIYRLKKELKAQRSIVQYRNNTITNQRKNYRSLLDSGLVGLLTALNNQQEKSKTKSEKKAFDEAGHAVMTAFNAMKDILPEIEKPKK